MFGGRFGEGAEEGGVDYVHLTEVGGSGVGGAMDVTLDSQICEEIDFGGWLFGEGVGGGD